MFAPIDAEVTLLKICSKTDKGSPIVTLYTFFSLLLDAGRWLVFYVFYALATKTNLCQI